MSRFKFFMWAFGAMFVYFWFPNYLFEALTFFSWMQWIAPNVRLIHLILWREVELTLAESESEYSHWIPKRHWREYPLSPSAMNDVAVS